MWAPWASDEQKAPPILLASVKTKMGGQTDVNIVSEIMTAPRTCKMLLITLSERGETIFYS